MRLRTVSFTLTALAGLAVLLPALANCGRPALDISALAQAPGMHKGNSISITVDGQAMSYKSAEADAQYDASTRVLSLYLNGDTFDDQDSLNHATCDFSSFNSISVGSYVLVHVKDFDPTKPGTFAATDAVIDMVDNNSGTHVTKKGALQGVTFNVTQSDDNRILGTISGGNVSGEIDAWPCYVDGGPGGMATVTQPAAPPSSSAAAAPTDSAAPASAAPDDAGAPDAKPKKKKHKK